jgi:methionyl-tRNA formyltransferase
VACADLMVRAVGALERGLLDTKPQPEEGITYAEKIGKEEARINWSKPARDVHNHIRGLSPFPGAWTEIEFNGKPFRLKILASELSAGNGQPGEVIDNRFTIACGEGALQILRVQRAGKVAQEVEEFLRGNRIDPGMVLG